MSSNTSTDTFSISQQYNKVINDIFHELPKGSKSRFICQAIVEKAQRTHNLEMFDLGGQNFNFGHQPHNEPLIKDEVPTKKTAFEKITEKLTSEEFEEHESSLKAFKDNKEMLETIVDGIVDNRVSKEEALKEESREEAVSIVNNW